MKRTNIKYGEAFSKRMKEKNPMFLSAIKLKMMTSMRGKTFLSRGGNGKLTKQQIALHNATGFPMEHTISILPVIGKFKSLPTHYKVDLAIPEALLAIEVDGKSHLLKKWKFLDRRKTEILNTMGWKVLRFSNMEVDKNLADCLEKIKKTVGT